MKKAITIGRYLLGALFLIFGSNGLLFFTTGKGFIPMPPPSPEMATVMQGFMATHYLMPLVKGLQVAAALLLLSNQWVNLALIFLAPIGINILAIHLFVEPAGLGMAFFINALIGLQIYGRWQHFKALVSRR